MSANFKIQVPATALGAGLPLNRVRLVAAEQATTSLLDTPVIDWLGNARDLRQVTDQIGNTHEIEFATRQLFLALVAEGMSYRTYRERIAHEPKSVGEDAKRAAHYYHHVFARSPELQSIGLGDGAILLARMNFYIEQQIKWDKASKGRVLQ
jgi:hypothetical protein